MSKTKRRGQKRRPCGADCTYCNPEGAKSDERRKLRHGGLGVRLHIAEHGSFGTPQELTPNALFIAQVLEEM